MTNKKLHEEIIKYALDNNLGLTFETDEDFNPRRAYTTEEEYAKATRQGRPVRYVSKSFIKPLVDNPRRDQVITLLWGYWQMSFSDFSRWQNLEESWGIELPWIYAKGIIDAFKEADIEVLTFVRPDYTKSAIIEDAQSALSALTDENISEITAYEISKILELLHINIKVLISQRFAANSNLTNIEIV